VTPIFQPAPSVMFVGEGGDLFDSCAAAVPYLSILRVKHAMAALERMMVTRPLVVVVNDEVSAADLGAIMECATNIGAEVMLPCPELRVTPAAHIGAAALAAERKRSGAGGPAARR
jgi:hypothetical protein